mgnify:CR=1 FL=1
MRLTGLDMARFLAYCGMVLVNFRLAAGVTGTGDLPSVLTDGLEGRAAALFVVLAGIGLGLGRGDRVEIFRRALFLFGIGLLNLTIFEADILHFYALYFLCALPVLRASSGVLWATMGGLLLVSVAAHAVLNYDAHWNWETLHYQDFWTLRGFLLHSFFNGWHPVLPWLGFVLIGLWLGRLELGSARVQWRLILWGTAAALLGALPAQLITDPELLPLFDTAMIPPGPTYMIAASGSAVAVIGLILRVAPRIEASGLAPWLVAPGRQALSLYILHIVVGMGLLEAFGRLDGSLSPSAIFGLSLLFCLASATYARLWARWSKMGPLEALMRRMTTRRN